ncbi:hypothetical protein AACH06_15250 [Ideonella sp. DXS29W]|uniref:Uncharacterized protein n=1 Tax=Ideonella lacteola TaxID=2984193 RepID=A0ABU9BQD7_9BURK
MLEWVTEHPKQASALGGLIVAALPAPLQLAGSLLLGVPYSDVLPALRENRLWKENLACASAPFDGLATPQNLQVDAVVCQSGHVLVRVKSPSGVTAYRWVPLESVIDQVSGGFGFIATAQAAAPSPPPALLVASVVSAARVGGGNFEVVCQQWLGNGLVRRRLLDRDSGRCVDEVVNTYTGKVVSTAPAPDCRC